MSQPLDQPPDETPLKSGAIRITIACDHCDAEYPVARISSAGVDIRSRITRLRQTGKGQSDMCRALERRFKREVTPLASA
jgi:hypothetical protein